MADQANDNVLKWDDIDTSAAGEETVAAEPEAVEAEVIEPEPEDEGDIVAEAEAVVAEVLEADAQADADIADAACAAAAEELKKAQAEAADWKNKYLRLHAEWDTYRRRTNEQREEEKVRAASKLVEALIPVIDDFERTIDYAEKNGEAGLLGGVQAVHNKFVDTLGKHGVEVINPVGEPYDALEAQAVAMVPDESVPDETVAEVYQKGYKMGKKVLRSAMVTVATGGPKREKPADAE